MIQAANLMELSFYNYRTCQLCADNHSNIGYFVAIKPSPFGILIICSLACNFCLADNQNQILYQYRAEQASIDYYFPVESNGGHFLWLDRYLLWWIGPNARHMGLSL